MRYNNLFFDLDGTLLDSFEGCADSFMAVYDHFGVAMDRADTRTMIGPPLRTTFTRILGQDKVDEGVEVYRDYYLKHGGQWNSRLFDGVPDMLKTVRKAGYKIYLATSKGEHAAVEILEKYGVAEYFDRIFGADYRIGRVEKEDVLQYAFDALGCDKAESLMIGDSVYDARGAKMLGIDCLACTYGFGSVEEMRREGIVAECSSTEAVADWLTR